MATVASEQDEAALPVTWSTTEDAIQDAVEHDRTLHEIADSLDNALTLDPDRDLPLDDTSLNSDSVPRDSDSTTSNSDSFRDAEDADSIEAKSRSTNGVNEESQSPSPDAASNGGLNVSPSGHKTTAESTSKNEHTSKHRPSIDSTSSSSRSRVTGHRPSIDSTSSHGKTMSVKSDSSSRKGSGSTSKNPLKMLKKLTKFDKAPKKVDPKSEFAAVVVDRLPQVFVVKYLGHRTVSGVCGLHHVRKPVDEMVREVKTKLDEQSEMQLPLLYVVVSPKGLDLREHKRNKVKDVAPLGIMPIDFISYGVQDIKYWRVFTCIVVRELSSRTRASTCHAFLCDSSFNGRKMALALGAAFSVYSKKLKSDGKEHNFQVELRPPDELADAVDAECEA